MDDQQQMTAAVRDLRSAVLGLQRAIRPVRPRPPRRASHPVAGPSHAVSWVMVWVLSMLVVGLGTLYGVLALAVVGL